LIIQKISEEKFVSFWKGSIKKKQIMGEEVVVVVVEPIRCVTLRKSWGNIHGKSPV
jgi:hypothetical protein